MPLGRYYADFASHHPKLVIEVDGWTHNDPDHDAERDRLWPSITEEQPQQAMYQARTSRRIPVVVMDVLEEDGDGTGGSKG